MRWVAVIAVGLLACGDDDSGSGQYVSVADFAGSYKEAECTYLTRCGLFADMPTCLAAHLQTSSAYELSADVRAEIAAGRVIYNGNAAFECFDAIANATCDKTDEAGRAPILACYQLTRGTLDADAPCQINASCISQQCRVSVADEQCAMGTCLGDTARPLTLPGAGESCNLVTGCGPGTFCETDTYECTPLKAAGADCISPTECAYGLGCVGTPKTCKALPAVNEACPDAVCRDEGVHCAAAVCKTLGLTGATCQSSADCSPYYPCNFSTTMCMKPPAIGEACASANSRCFEDHSFCDSATLRCVAGLPDGSACTFPVQCASEYCDDITGTCITPSCSG